MKTKIFFLLFFLCSVCALGQNVTSKEGFSVTPPKFTGVQATAQVIMEQQYPTVEKFLKERVSYPARAQEEFAQGTEVIGYTVSTKGEITNIKVINSVSRDIDDEVIAALEKTSGMWKPAIINGEPVAMEGQEIALVFKLSEQPDYFISSARKYFSKGAESVLVNHNPNKALRFFDKAVVLLPNDRSLLALRGLTRFEIGDKSGAVQDWTRIKNLGGLEGDMYIREYVSLSGYNEMTAILNK